MFYNENHNRVSKATRKKPPTAQLLLGTGGVGKPRVWERVEAGRFEHARHAKNSVIYSLVALNCCCATDNSWTTRGSGGVRRRRPYLFSTSALAEEASLLSNNLCRRLTRPLGATTFSGFIYEELLLGYKSKLHLDLRPKHKPRIWFLNRIVRVCFKTFALRLCVRVNTILIAFYDRSYSNSAKLSFR